MAFHDEQLRTLWSQVLTPESKTKLGNHREIHELAPVQALPGRVTRGPACVAPTLSEPEPGKVVPAGCS